MACVGVSNTILYPGTACVGVSSSLSYIPHPNELGRVCYFCKCGTVFYRVRYGAVRYIHLVSPERTLLSV